MKLEGEQVLLRVYLRNTDKVGWGAAGDALVQEARRRGMAGATLFRGILGLDVAGQLLEARPWALVEHLPVIVECVDEAPAIGAFLPVVAHLVPEGMATLERAHVLAYREGKTAGERPASRLRVPAAVPAFACLPATEDYPAMQSSEEGILLRIFIGESDVWEGVPLYRAIVLKAQELGMAGATVLRGGMGFGAHSRVHTNKLLELSTDLPVVIEIVDTPERITALLPVLDQMVGEGLITLENVRVLRYRRDTERV
jgi:PII-like signaling protein